MKNIFTSLMILFLLSEPALTQATAGDLPQSNVFSPIPALQQTRWIPVGSRHPRHVVYFFLDPNCPYCHDLWSALQPYYRRGLETRIVLVGILSATSPGKAAAILEARNPSKALQQNENKWGTRVGGGGGIEPLPNPSRASLSTLAADRELMQRLGIPGTPALVYKDGVGKVHVVEGAPDGGRLAQIIRAAAVP